MRTTASIRIVTVAVLATFVAGAAAQPAPPPATPGEAVFVISGRGWGHGVGMGQYGAYGMARAGRSYEEILAHYYADTTVGPSAVERDVRVLLAEGRRAVTIASAAPFTVVDPSGARHRLAGDPLTLRTELALPDEDGPRRVRPPLILRPGKAPLSLDGRLYRGRLVVAVANDYLRVVNHLPLESYLQGVVAGEVPHTWPTEVLKAQAVAARSYALATLVEGKPFDLYADVRSQVYLGVAGEQPRTTDAVRATAGEVVLYGGKVATTYYFSTSGGRTASAADVFGFSVPYLVSRPDPWDKLSPYHRWGPVLVSARAFGSKLGLEPRVLDATGVTTPSGRLRSVVVQTPEGSAAVPGTAVRTALGLRSTWMTVGVLRLDQPRGTVLFGSDLRLTGVARALPSPSLSSSASGATWSTVGPLTRDGSGAVSATVTPARTLRYRIDASGASSSGVLVQVTPRIRLRQSLEPGVLTGSIRPRLRGAPVVIERRGGHGWAEVAEAVVDGAGTFRVELELRRGAYRARVPATGGLAAAVGPTVAVTP